MRAIIIAGGLGTRLRPLTYNTPKSIMPVANKPFVLHQIELLKKHGITEIILNLHYLSDSIKEIFKDGKKLGVKIFYSIEESPLGTAGAVKNAEEYFDEDPLVVFNGDILTDIDIRKAIEFHKKNKARATLVLKRVDDPTAYGLVILNESGAVKKFIEKPSWEMVTDNTINAGLYILDPKIFKDVPKDQKYSFERELFPKLLKQKEKVFGFVSDAFWLDIGTPGKYMLAHRAILRKDLAVVIPGKEKKSGVWIEVSANVDDSVKLRGPAIIGKDVKISAGAEVFEFSVLGDDVRVGENTRIRETIILAGSRIGKNVNLSHCVLGFNTIIEDNVIVEGGVVLADGTIIKEGSKLGAAL